MARNWLLTCATEHESCKAGREPDFFPSRLIDVGTSDDTIRLVLTSDCDFASDTPYFALSHCWGTDRGIVPLRTTTKNITQFLDRIDPSELSKTFRDAIEVVRRLGLSRYLWIDSLCIIQDWYHDFTVECAKMDRVYSQAYCTIVVSL